MTCDSAICQITEKTFPSSMYHSISEQKDQNFMWIQPSITDCSLNLDNLIIEDIYIGTPPISRVPLISPALALEFSAWELASDEALIHFEADQLQLMNRGDIVFVNLPTAPGRSGHEQVGLRPALIVHDDSTISSLPVVAIIPFTSNSSASRFPHTVSVNPSSTNGLSMTSHLMVFQLRVIDKTRIMHKVGVMESSTMLIIERELRAMLGL